MENQVTIQSELKRREDLIHSVDFRQKCAVAAKELGITKKEWDENKSAILMLMANQYCSLENRMN